MPLTLSQLAPFISQPTQPRYHGGLARAADTFMAMRAADQRSRGLDLQEAGQAADQAARAAADSRARENLDIQRGYLSLQGDKQMADREDARRKMEQAAIADFVDSLSPTADPMRREAALANLRTLGLSADAPGGGAPGPAPIPEAAAPSASATSPLGAPAAQPPLGLAQEDNAFNWVAPVRPDPARMDVLPPEAPPGPPLEIQQAPLGKIAPSGPSAPALASPETARLAGGAAGLAGRPMTMGALDATRALPGLGLGVQEAAPGLPQQGAQPAAAAAAPSAPSPVPGAPALGGLGPTVPPVAPTPEIAAWRLRRGDDVLMELDPSQGAKLRDSVIADAFAPLVASAKTPEQRRAAALGMDTAKRVMAAGEPTKVAIEKGREAYEFEIKEANATMRAGMAAGARVTAAQREFGSTGMGKDDYAVRNDLTQHVDKVVQQVSSQKKVSAVNETALEFDKLLALSNERTGFADSNAVVSFITAMQQRVSNADYTVAMGSGGVVAQLQNFVNRFDPSKGGALSPTYMKQVKGAAEALRQSIFQEKLKIAAQAEGMMRERARILRLSPEDEEDLVSAVRRPFVPEGYKSPRDDGGPRRAPIPAQHGGGSRATPEASPAPGRAGESRAERIRRLTR